MAVFDFIEGWDNQSDHRVIDGSLKKAKRIPLPQYLRTLAANTDSAILERRLFEKRVTESRFAAT